MKKRKRKKGKGNSDIALFNVSHNLSTLQDETGTFIGHHFLLLYVRQTRHTLSKIYNIFRGLVLSKSKQRKAWLRACVYLRLVKHFSPFLFFFIFSLSLSLFSSSICTDTKYVVLTNTPDVRFRYRCRRNNALYNSALLRDSLFLFAKYQD